MRAVYAVAADARSIAFLKRAVAISSIVRVILRMFLIERRRLSRRRGLAIDLRVAGVARLQFWAEFLRIQPRLVLHGYGLSSGGFLLRCFRSEERRVGK